MSSETLTPEEIEALKHRHIRSFVLRRGHISAAQERALDDLFPKYEAVYEVKPFDAEKAFGRKAPLVLEIGCGMGETTAAIAEAHPEVDFLGCEVFAAGVGALSKLLEEKGLTLSNPLIIFLFVGLFARFAFVSEGVLVFEAVTGYLAIALGALTWWFGITFFVNKVRTQFNLRGIWILNRIIGGIVMVVSAFGLVFTLMGESLY